MLYLHLSSHSPFFATSFHKCSLRFLDMLSSPASPSSPIPAYQNFPFLFDSPVVYAIFRLWRLLIPVVSFPKVLVVTVMPGQSATFDFLIDLRYCWHTCRYLKCSLSPSPSLFPSQSNFTKQTWKNPSTIKICSKITGLGISGSWFSICSVLPPELFLTLQKFIFFVLIRQAVLFFFFFDLN